MRHTIFFLLLPACTMGLDSTIVVEEGQDPSLDGSLSEDGLASDEDGEPGEEEETPIAMDLDGVYEAPDAFYIDVDAIDGSTGSVLATDTCVGELTIEIDMDMDPSVFGRGDCVLQNFGIQGRGELSGSVDPYTGEIDGWISLTLDTDPVEVPWTGTADEWSVVGTFEGSLPYADASYNLDLDYLGEFEADR